MSVRAIELNSRADKLRFIRFPFDLYRNTPQWVPPFISDLFFAMNRAKHPFYEHSEAEFFLCEENGRVTGRVCVLNNQKFNDYHRSKTAFFYFFESVKDEKVVRSLMDATENWARKKGLNRIIGPLGVLQGDSIGLLVEGFEHRPAVGIGYNHAYYDQLLKSCGYSKLTDYYSGYLSGHHRLPQRFFDIAEKVKKQRDFQVKSFRSKRELRQWVLRIQEVYNKAFADNFEFSPLSEKEAKTVAERLLAIAEPRLIKLVMKGEEIIGFLFAFSDISAAIQKTKGQLFPFGWITLMREFKKTEWVNFNGTGLLPGHRGVGANAVLYTEMSKTIRERGFEHADIVQVEEENIKSMGDMKAIGVEWHKKHRVYQKSL